MQNFQYQIPTKLLFGENCINSLPFLLEKFGRNILLVYGCGSIKRIGLYDRLKELLSDFEITEYAGVHPNPEYAEDVLPGIQLGLNRDIDVVLAVGGGSVLDCAKTIAAGVCYEGDVWDLISYKRPVKAALPIVTVVTTASSGSEYDNGAVISRIETHDKLGFAGDSLYPLYSFVDPTYTYTVPKEIMLAGIADVMSHYMEEYFNADPQMLMDGVMESAMRTLVKNAPRALANPEDYQVRSEISLAATFSCNAIISVGEGKSSWPMHAIENIINGYFDIQHGAGMAIVIPRWMSCVLKKYPETASRIATFGMKVFELGSDLGSEALSEAGDDFLQSLAKETIDTLHHFFLSLGLQMKLTDLPMIREAGLNEEKLQEMARRCIKTTGISAAHSYAPLDEADVLAIMKACL